MITDAEKLDLTLALTYYSMVLRQENNDDIAETAQVLDDETTRVAKANPETTPDWDLFRNCVDRALDEHSPGDAVKLVDAAILILSVV